MSKRGYISRYLLIIKKLKAKPFTTYAELNDYFNSQLEFLQLQDESLSMGFSQRTFQRDLRDIRNTFGIDIEYSRSQKGYFIVKSEMENMNFQRMIEAYDLFNTLNFAQDLQPIIHLEKRKPQGTDNLHGLIHAIKNMLQIKFSYQKFWEDTANTRTAEPYALKEFKNRWYLLSKDLKDDQIKSFALDRLTNLDITKKSFTTRTTFDVEEYYRYCFGIVSPNGKPPEEIVLSFNAYQGKYIKSLPLHETQQILVDNENELQIKLKLCITYDFVMELLSLADNMKVIKPKSLIKEIKDTHQRAVRNYEK